jgi:hypothetical protein
MVGVTEAMKVPVFVQAFVKRGNAPTRSANSALTHAGGPAYIGGGPHLPNEVLSFWKE